MPWQMIVLVGYFVVDVLAGVALIGRDRPPLTPGVAVVLMGIYTLLVTLTLSIPYA